MADIWKDMQAWETWDAEKMLISHKFIFLRRAKVIFRKMWKLEDSQNLLTPTMIKRLMSAWFEFGSVGIAYDKEKKEIGDVVVLTNYKEKLGDFASAKAYLYAPNLKIDEKTKPLIEKATPNTVIPLLFDDTDLTLTPQALSEPFAYTYAKYKLIHYVGTHMLIPKVQENTFGNTSQLNEFMNAIENVSVVINAQVSAGANPFNAKNAFDKPAKPGALGLAVQKFTGIPDMPETIHIDAIESALSHIKSDHNEMLGYRSNIGFKKERAIIDEFNAADTSFYLMEQDRADVLEKFADAFEKALGSKVTVFDVVSTRLEEMMKMRNAAAANQDMTNTLSENEEA